MNTAPTTECPSIYNALQERLWRVRAAYLRYHAKEPRMKFVIGRWTLRDMKREPAMMMGGSAVDIINPCTDGIEFEGVPGRVVNDLPGFIVFLEP